jgi:hypothetical protein
VCADSHGLRSVLHLHCGGAPEVCVLLEAVGPTWRLASCTCPLEAVGPTWQLASCTCPSGAWWLSCACLFVFACLLVLSCACFLCSLLAWWVCRHGRLLLFMVCPGSACGAPWLLWVPLLAGTACACQCGPERLHMTFLVNYLLSVPVHQPASGVVRAGPAWPRCESCCAGTRWGPRSAGGCQAAASGGGLQ